jgi:hypothetical protein|tara:strand:+ start:813 stop:1529 length:717 start_codon:yes stop_codon:yes gene_type:complete
MNYQMKELDEEIKQAAKRAQSDFMPIYKAKHFVGMAQITPYGAMKQYFLELAARQEMMWKTEYDTEIIEIKIAKLNKEAETTTDELDLRGIANELREMKRRLGGFQLLFKGQTDEIDMYVKLIKELDESSDGITAKGERLLDIIHDAEKNQDLEREYWILRMGKQSAMDMIAYGKVGVGNIDSLTMMDKDAQRKALGMAADVLVWHENRMHSILNESNKAFQIEQDTALTKHLMLTKD